LAQTLARRASPYGLALLPDTQRYPSAEPPSEAAIQRRWQRRCEELGGAILGIRDVPTEPVVAQLEGVRWLLEPLGARERWMPAHLFNQVRGFEGADVPFKFEWWLWGEEQRPHPSFRPFPDPAAQRRDPLLIGVIKTGLRRGLWVLVARWDD
jgi:hypothetical protein